MPEHVPMFLEDSMKSRSHRRTVGRNVQFAVPRRRAGGLGFARVPLRRNREHHIRRPFDWGALGRVRLFASRALSASRSSGPARFALRDCFSRHRHLAGIGHASHCAPAIECSSTDRDPLRLCRFIAVSTRLCEPTTICCREGPFTADHDLAPNFQRARPPSAARSLRCRLRLLPRRICTALNSVGKSGLCRRRSDVPRRKPSGGCCPGHQHRGRSRERAGRPRLRWARAGTSISASQRVVPGSIRGDRSARARRRRTLRRRDRGRALRLRDRIGSTKRSRVNPPRRLFASRSTDLLGCRRWTRPIRRSRSKPPAAHRAKRRRSLQPRARCRRPLSSDPRRRALLLALADRTTPIAL